ncbi:hypothetical protein [Acinetobacter larvae]|uniref:Uncharacterized protein n=1 Tax=Acinetobacter larvae TaxID=1789224 RepID=A0A1B2M2B6_9GAMM|nr:hypothetical protein [Acinetobacter larvae]AOA59340.1 hypothetical protein BFG52_13900 [Acinetobacter larvae]
MINLNYLQVNSKVAISSLLSMLLLSACDNYWSNDVQDFSIQHSDHAASELVEHNQAYASGDGDDVEQGMRLTDVVGQYASPPPQQEHSYRQGRLSAEEVKYIGRYHTFIPCSDEFIACNQGYVEYILNLRPDGTAHRTIIHLGRLYSGQIGTIKSYRKDSWNYDEQHKELVIHLVEGAELFYSVNERLELRLNIEKTLNVNQLNHDFFSKRYPAPNYSYVLKKYAEM